MFGKLVYGQFSLKETFWKFGLAGIFICAVLTKIFNAFLMQKLKGVGLGYYYTHYFSPLHIDGMVLFLTIGYLLTAFILCAYSVMVVLGVWRSSAEYDKSIWLRHIARLVILLVIYAGLEYAL